MVSWNLWGGLIFADVHPLDPLSHVVLFFHCTVQKYLHIEVAIKTKTLSFFFADTLLFFHHFLNVLSFLEWQGSPLVLKEY